MTSPVPPEAITAAERAIRDRYTITGPDVDRRVKFVMGDVRAALEAAAPHLAAAERESCAQLAEELGAVYPVTCTEFDCPCGPGESRHSRPFADQLRKDDRR